jgi:hypothetical protein
MNNLLSGLPVLYGLITFVILMSLYSLCLAGFRRAERTQPRWGHEKLGYYSAQHDSRVPYSPPQQQQEHV